MQKKKILLTGSSGFLGNEIFKFLIKKYQCGQSLGTILDLTKK